MATVPERDGCLDGNRALEFANGLLSPDDVARVDEHLDRCPDCRCAVAEAVHALRERSTRPIAEPGTLARLAVDTVLAGRYRILRFLARGGMGEVYEAEDRLLNERIALKTLVSSISDDERAVQRLKSEVNFARRVTHPSVCRIFDIGVHQPAEASGRSGVFFITMELVPGISLGQRLRQGPPFELAEARPLVDGMAAALSAAHRVGVIHRDFKSDNVMLAPVDGGPPRVVVMDFGLARVYNELSSSGISQDGQGFVGTVGYMSPEQVRGDPVSAASDVYALGVVMFEMATGRLPFRGDSPIEIATRRLIQPAPSPRVFVPTLDERWERTILRCLQKDPRRRFQRLEAVTDSLNGPAAAPVAGGRQGRRLAIGLGAVGLVALAASRLRRRWAQPLTVSVPLPAPPPPPEARVALPGATPPPDAQSPAPITADMLRAGRTRRRKSAAQPSLQHPALSQPPAAAPMETAPPSIAEKPPASDPSSIQPPPGKPAANPPVKRRSQHPDDGLIAP